MQEPKSQTKRREILVRLLANYFRQIDPIPDHRLSGCACTTPDCVVLGCDKFWEGFFARFNAEDVRRMIESYMVARGCG